MVCQCSSHVYFWPNVKKIKSRDISSKSIGITQISIGEIHRGWTSWGLWLISAVAELVFFYLIMTLFLFRTETSGEAL